MRRLITAFTCLILCFYAQLVTAQTASITEGCLPLEVKFTAPAAAGYYWDFKDNTTSDLQNPTHIFTSAGNYSVQLFDSPNGNLIGEILINVYPDPIVNFTGDPKGGCAPLQVQFTNNIIIVDSIEILTYLWAFGDGNSSMLQNPGHNYQNAGNYAVSLEIRTSPANCGITRNIPDYIQVESTEASFSLDRYSSCDIPATFNITSISDHVDGNTYMWDFDNGETADVRDPGSVTYTTPGNYLIRFTVTNSAGCSKTYSRQVIIGAPKITLDVPDTVCLDLPYIFNNASGTSFSEWSFGPNAIPQTSNIRNPQVTFNSPGPQTITLSTWIFPNCKSDTTFTVFVDFADADFTFDPFITCFDPTTVQVTAANPNMATYIWNDTIIGGPVENIVYTGPIRDSLHINRHDTIPLFLYVESSSGCVDTTSHFFIQRKPDAYFLANRTKGCAPLEVTFADSSLSTEQIIRWKWLFGDGTEISSGDNSSQTHVYNTPGEYYVRLIVENVDGCIDTSFGVWIFVGEQIIPEYTIDKQEICLGDTVNIEFTNIDDRIDAWHFDSDNGRFNHCWKSPSASHAFITEPGTFDVDLVVEYNGCYGTLHEEDKILVKGAKADISYMINCDSPFDVMLWNESLNEGSFAWYFPEPDTSFEDSLTHTFGSTGDYTIILEAQDALQECPVSVDSAEVFIRDIQANFTVESRLCDNEAYLLDASASVDVDNDCSKGYLWNLPGSRPREVSMSSISHQFPRGPGEVRLIVEDINGCTDTLTKDVTAYGIDPSFVKDKDRICFPATVNFEDLSTGDTTIVEWEWNFGSQSPVTSFTYTDSTSDSLQTIILVVTDELGCKDTTSQILNIYDPFSNIASVPMGGVCIGDSINFTATDFTTEGSFLNFDWDFGGISSSDEQNPGIVFNSPGDYDIVLTYTEDASGCEGMDTLSIQAVGIPEADFATNFDGQDIICYPATTIFTNNSSIDGPGGYAWNLGNGVQTSLPNPTITYEKGTFNIQLIASSIYGCADTTSRAFTFIGPEGTFTVDKTNVCKGDEITFSIQDTVDVASFTWDFGDGETAENVSPVTHTYNFNPPSGTTLAKLILKSAFSDSACTIVDTIPIGINELDANFAFDDSLSGYCIGRAQFTDMTSGNPTSWQWDFGNGQSSTEQNPVNVYPTVGEFEVTLQVLDEDSGCADDTTAIITLEDVKQFYGMPNVFTPGGDAINDNFNIVVDPKFANVVSVREFKIYNRWGKLIYDNDDPAMGWDGTFDGQNSPAEVYAYYIQIEIEECRLATLKGNVSILR